MWNRFDICLAYYVYAMYWHGGMSSPEYALFSVFSRLRFEPRRMADTAAQHSERSRSLMAHGEDYDNARTILASLIRRGRKGWHPRLR